MLKIRLALITVLLLLNMGCSSKNPVTDSIPKQVSVKEAKKMIDENKIQVVDVRTPEEFKDGHIPGAKLIPLQDVEKRLGEFNKEQAYLLVCHSGNRSVQAQDILEKHGFNNTYNMLQGMAQWPYKTEK